MSQALAAGALPLPPSLLASPQQKSSASLGRGQCWKQVDTPAQGQAPGQRWNSGACVLIHMLVHMVFHNHGLKEKSKKPFLKPFMRHHVLYQCDTTSTSLGFEVTAMGVL